MVNIMKFYIQGKAAVRKPLSESDQYQEQAADKINQAMSGGGMYNDDDIKIDENDLKLAEKLIAEINVDLTNFPEHKFTICSTSAEELSIMDEVLCAAIRNVTEYDRLSDHPDIE